MASSLVGNQHLLSIPSLNQTGTTIHAQCQVPLHSAKVYEEFKSAISANNVEKVKELFSKNPFWPFRTQDPALKRSDTLIQWVQEKFHEFGPFTFELHSLLEEHFCFRHLLSNMMNLTLKYSKPDELLEVMCTTLELFMEYSQQFLTSKRLTHHCLNFAFFQLVSKSYEQLIDLCFSGPKEEHIPMAVVKEIELSLAKLLWPLVEYTKFLSLETKTKIDLLNDKHIIINHLKELQLHIDKINNIKIFFSSFHYGMLQYDQVKTLHSAITNAKLTKGTGKNSQNSSNQKYSLYFIMKDIGALERILGYIDQAVCVGLNNIDIDSSSELHMKELVIERALQVAGEYLKFAEKTPQLSKDRYLKIKQAGVPIDRISQLRDLMSHCSTIMAFSKSNNNAVDINLLKSVQNDLNKIKKVIRGILKQLEIVQIQMLLMKIPIHHLSSLHNKHPLQEDVKQLLVQISGTTSHRDLQALIQNLCQMINTTAYEEVGEIAIAIQEIQYVVKFKEISEDIQILHDSISKFMKMRTQNLDYFQDYDQKLRLFDKDYSDVKSHIDTISNVKGIEQLYVSKVKGSGCKSSTEGPELIDILLKDVLELERGKQKQISLQVLTSTAGNVKKTRKPKKFKFGLGLHLDKNSLNTNLQLEPDNLLEVLLNCIEILSEDKLNFYLSEFVNGSLTTDDIFQLLTISDIHKSDLQSLLVKFCREIASSIGPKHVLDSIFQKLMHSSKELLLDDKLENIKSALEQSLDIHYAKAKLIVLCSGTKSLDHAEFNKLTSKLQCTTPSAKWDAYYLDRSSCKTYIANSVKDSYGNLIKVIQQEHQLDNIKNGFEMYLKELNFEPSCATVLSHFFQHELKVHLEKTFLSTINQLDKLLSTGNINQDITDECVMQFKNNENLKASVEMLVLKSMSTLKDISHPDVFPKLEKLIQIHISHMSEQEVQCSSIRNYLAHGELLTEMLDSSILRAVILAAIILAQHGIALLAISKLIEDEQGSTFLFKCLRGLQRSNFKLQCPAMYKEQLEMIKQSKYWTNNAWKMTLITAIYRQTVEQTKGLKYNHEDFVKILEYELCSAVCFNDIRATAFWLSQGVKNDVGSKVQSALHIAAASGSQDVIISLLKNGFQVNFSLQENQTPLHLAVFNKHQETVKSLLQNGANAKVQDANHFTPLAIAAMVGENDIIEILIQNDDNFQEESALSPLLLAIVNGHANSVSVLLKNENLVNAFDGNSLTPLHFAITSGYDKITQMLLENGACVNGPIDSKSVTPLQLAVSKENLSNVNLLLTFKVDVNLTSTDMNSPLHFACKLPNGQEITTALINAGANVNCLNIENCSPLHVAANTGTLKQAEVLLDNGANIEIASRTGLTALHFAARGGHIHIVKLLIHKQAKVNVITENQDMPLHMALDNGHLDTCNLLLQNGANINATVIQGPHQKIHFPLKTAVVEEYNEFVGTLLHFGADVNQVDESHMTVLHFASVFGSLTVIEKLIEAKANVDAKNTGLRTPLHFAVANGHFIAAKALMENGAEVNAVDCNGNSVLNFVMRSGSLDIIQLLLYNGADLNIVDGNRRSVLHLAVQFLHLEVIPLLLNHGANVDALDRLNQTPLHQACQVGGLEHQTDASNSSGALQRSRNIQIIEALIQGKADVNAVDIHKRTPLHCAAKSDDADVIQVLLEHLAVPNKSDIYGQTPLQLAESLGYRECVTVLQQKGTNIVNKSGVVSTFNSQTAVTGNNISDPINIWIKKLMKAVQLANVELAKKLLSNQTTFTSGDLNDYSLLHISIENGDIKTTEELIKFGMEINNCNSNGLAPIHLAVQFGYFNIFTLLLEKDADINGVTKIQQLSALHLAVLNEDIDIITSLVSNSKIIINVRNSSGKTPLHLACKMLSDAMAGNTLIYEESLQNIVKIVKALLDHGADVTSTSRSGNTPLHYCILSGNIDIAKLLLSRDVIVNCANGENKTALHIAAERGHHHVIPVLIENGAKVDGGIEDTDSPLHLAVEKGHSTVVDSLISNGANINAENGKKQTPLHLAAHNNHYDIVKNLLKNGAVIDAVDNCNCTPLLLAVQEGIGGIVHLLLEEKASVHAMSAEKWSVIHQAVLKQDIVILEDVINHGANVDQVGKDGWTPLHLAASNDALEMVKLLLKNKAKVNVPDSEGRMPHHIAGENGNHDILEALVMSGANVHIGGKAGTPLLFKAVRGGNLQTIQLLLDKNVDISVCENEITALNIAIRNMYVDVVNVLLNNKADINFTMADGMNYMHFAAIMGSSPIIRALYKHGLGVNGCMTNGKTPLHISIIEGNGEAARCLLGLKADCNAIYDGDSPLNLAVKYNLPAVVQSLIKCGADVNFANPTGHTALHDASLTDNPYMFNALLTHGAEINIVLANGSNMLHHASCAGSEEITKFLLDKKFSVNKETLEGQTPLHMASTQGFAQIVTLLLEKGAHVNAIDAHHHTALLCLAFGTAAYSITMEEDDTTHKRDFLKTAELLLSAGADVNAKNMDNLTTLHIAADQNFTSLVKLLLENQPKANVDGNTCQDYAPLQHAAEHGHVDTIQILLSHKANLSLKNCDGETALILATRKGHLEAVKLLMENNACRYSKSNNNATILHESVRKDKIMLKFMLDILKSESELENFINSQDNDGDTPLIWAVELGSLEAAELLLQYGADGTIANKSGSIAMNLAKSTKHLGLISLLNNKV